MILSVSQPHTQTVRNEAFLFTHHNATRAKICPHPFQLEMNWEASFSVKKETMEEKERDK